MQKKPRFHHHPNRNTIDDPDEKPQVKNLPLRCRVALDLPANTENTNFIIFRKIERKLAKMEGIMTEDKRTWKYHFN